jgi:hypothetical protein
MFLFGSAVYVYIENRCISCQFEFVFIVEWISWGSPIPVRVISVLHVRLHHFWICFLSQVQQYGGTCLAGFCRENKSFVVLNSLTENYSFSWSHLNRYISAFCASELEQIHLLKMHFDWNIRQWAKSRNWVILHGARS